MPSLVRAGSGNATRVSPPARDGSTQTGRSGKDRGQRPTRRARSARRGRGGRWPGAVAPGWPRDSAALWQGRWPLPERPDISENARPGGSRKRDPRFPRPSGTVPCRSASPGTAEASARPGGREAPAGGGAGAGRGLWPPAGQGSAWRCGRGDGPCQRDRASRNAKDRHSGRGHETHRVSPARARQQHVNRQVHVQRRPAPDPAGGEAPAGGGAGAGRGLWDPGGHAAHAPRGRGNGPGRNAGETFLAPAHAARGAVTAFASGRGSYRSARGI